MKVRSSRQSLQLLIAGRVHAVALKTKPYYLMLSREFKAANPELAEQIWNAIGELREEKLEALAQPYLSEPG